MEMEMDWLHWQEKRSPAFPCPSCWEGGNNFGDTKTKEEERRGRNPTRLVCSASSGQLPFMPKSASGAFILLIFAAIQSLLSVILHVEVAHLLSCDGSAACPQGLPCPQGREGAGTAGLKAQIWPEPAQPV